MERWLFIVFYCSILLPAAGQVPNDAKAFSIEQLNTRAETILSAKPDSAFLSANEALRLANEQSNLLEQGNSHQIIGKIFFQQAVYLQSLDHLLKAEEIFRDLEDLSKLASNLNHQGLVLYNIRQRDKAYKTHQEALAIFESLKDKKGVAYSYGCIGRLFEKKAEYSKALEYQKKALGIYESISDEQGIATILENIGSILEDQEDYITALEYFRQALRLNEATHDSLSMILNLNNIGDNYRKTGKYDVAVAFTEKALAISKNMNNRYQISSAYKDLSKSYHLAGKDNLAYDNLELGRTLYEEIFAQDASSQLALMQTLFEMERKNNSIQYLKSSQRLDSVIKFSLVFGLIMMAGLGAVIISRQRLKIRKDKEELIGKQQRYEADNKLMQAELENTHLREGTLKQELEIQSKLLSTHTLHMMGKNKMLEDIQLKLTDLLANEREEQRRKIKGLVKMIEHNFVHDKDWEDFGQIFGQVHKDFFEKLRRNSRDLTAADLRLASLIRLNLSSQDISSALGISPESLRMARYRLKKKLVLEEGQSLSSFIHGIN